MMRLSIIGSIIITFLLVGQIVEGVHRVSDNLSNNNLREKTRLKNYKNALSSTLDATHKTSRLEGFLQKKQEKKQEKEKKQHGNSKGPEGGWDASHPINIGVHQFIPTVNAINQVPFIPDGLDLEWVSNNECFPNFRDIDTVNFELAPPGRQRVPNQLVKTYSTTSLSAQLYMELSESDPQHIDGNSSADTWLNVPLTVYSKHAKPLPGERSLLPGAKQKNYTEGTTESESNPAGMQLLRYDPSKVVNHAIANSQPDDPNSPTSKTALRWRDSPRISFSLTIPEEENMDFVDGTVWERILQLGWDQKYARIPWGTGLSPAQITEQMERKKKGWSTLDDFQLLFNRKKYMMQFEESEFLKNRDRNPFIVDTPAKIEYIIPNDEIKNVQLSWGYIQQVYQDAKKQLNISQLRQLNEKAYIRVEFRSPRGYHHRILCKKVPPMRYWIPIDVSFISISLWLGCGSDSLKWAPCFGFWICFCLMACQYVWNPQWAFWYKIGGAEQSIMSLFCKTLSYLCGTCCCWFQYGAIFCEKLFSLMGFIGKSIGGKVWSMLGGFDGEEAGSFMQNARGGGEASSMQV